MALCFVTAAKAQNTETDSLKKLLAATSEESKRVLLFDGLSYAYLSSYTDTALHYALEGLRLAEKINYRMGEAYCMMLK